ncbi:uncharacterized protein LOC127011757 isoform X2 [Drosophila biarmipes]|uniref:uncharacterized protein LOC127011757 isoform X2 n=1 Tax=Drosophila biarmipes TaxID=125945 RepID=UPI0021CC7BF8|nr:uncharacterized protein LOC127011757 isoform X2 [Drosophila biarmipes]
MKEVATSRGGHTYIDSLVKKMHRKTTLFTVYLHYLFRCRDEMFCANKNPAEFYSVRKDKLARDSGDPNKCLRKTMTNIKNKLTKHKTRLWNNNCNSTDK